MNVVPLVVFAVCAATACAQTFTVVPAAHAAADANSHLWLAGAVAPLRQQTIVGASHLQALVGRTLTALEVRRTAANEAFVGGTATMAVTLSITSAAPLAASPTFAANVGPAPVTVFAGSVTLPASPAATGASVAWSPQNTVRIPFATPFVYPGGNLLVDLQGQPIAGMNAPWWMADAVFEDVAGALVTVGTGCGAFGGAPQEWSQADVRTLAVRLTQLLVDEGAGRALGDAGRTRVLSTFAYERFRDQLVPLVESISERGTRRAYRGSPA